MDSKTFKAAPGSSGRRIRRRTERDLDGCVAVLAAVHRCNGYPVNWPDCPGDWLTPSSLLSAWVAELKGEVVGHIGLSRSGPGDLAPGVWRTRAGVSAETAAVVGQLFVSPAARGCGVGASLLTQAVGEARARGLHPVLDVVASDTAAVALYERLGWELLAVVEQQWSPVQSVTVRCYAAPSA